VTSHVEVTVRYRLLIVTAIGDVVNQRDDITDISSSVEANVRHEADTVVCYVAIERRQIRRYMKAGYVNCLRGCFRTAEEWRLEQQVPLRLENSSDRRQPH